MNTNIQNIILNFFNNDCNLSELKTLLDFIIIEENYIQFNEYVCINYLSNLSINQFDKTSIIKDLESRIKKQEKQLIIRSRNLLCNFWISCTLSSGTTPKLIDNERHIPMIGY